MMATNDRLSQFAAIETAMNTISAKVSRLSWIYKEREARTSVDDGLIDELIVDANGLIVAANALKSVAYDPTPPESAP